MSSLGRKSSWIFLFLSLVALLLGYILGGILAEINWRFAYHHFSYIRTEYIYSIIYGVLFYTALVTLVRNSLPVLAQLVTFFSFFRRFLN